MTKQVKRSYDSSKRREQARQTRARIRDAAADLFVRDGYAATTIAAIAHHAGVSPPTIYATFGNKAALLADAIDVALAGDDEPLAMAERPEAHATAAATSPAEAATLFARFGTDVLARAGMLLRVAEAAVQHDPALHPLWLAGHRGRLADMRRTATGFATAGFLRDGIDADAAADILWVITDPAVYSSFRLIRGLSDQQYEQWVRDTVTTLLFDT